MNLSTVIIEQVDGKVFLTRRSAISGELNRLEMPCTEEQLWEYYESKKLVQEVFPGMDADLREFIISGITPREWDDEFNPDYVDGEK